jgi:hypothetical protein
LLAFLLIVIGIGGMVASAVLPFVAGSSITGGTGIVMDGSQFCEEGETYEEANGASTYTQGSGYASTVVMECVDEEGNRRVVTGEFAEANLGAVGGIVLGVGGLFAGMALSCIPLTLGIVLFIVSFFVGNPASPKRKTSSFDLD